MAKYRFIKKDFTRFIWQYKLLAHIFFLLSGNITGQESGLTVFNPKARLLTPDEVQVKGLLGEAISVSEKNRLISLPVWNDGELIRIFSKDSRLSSKTNDWYGEHAGKWLYTAALAVNRTNDEKLKSLLFRTADYLVSTQEEDGYLGTYSPDRRITNNNAVSHLTSWDVWNLSYMVLGLLEVNRWFPSKNYVDASEKIGELFLNTFGEGKQNITRYGTRRGISATIILDPVVELYRITGDRRYLDLAHHVIQQMEEREGLHLVSDALQNRDMENVGDGKVYQLCWNLTAVAKLYQMTGNEDFLKTAENAWNNIKDFHLSITGGPWGGIGKHKECFNSKGFWSPYGYIETCSIMSWIQLNCEMFKVTGESKYAEEIEKSAYNALLGAQYPNGLDWCYFSFTNGRSHVAHFNDCCPSSGALALEELSPVIYSLKGRGIACNIYTESEASITLPGSIPVRIVQKTDYPFEGKIQITLHPQKASFFPLFIRIPQWTDKVDIMINGKPEDTSKMKPGDYFIIERKWKAGDVIDIDFPIELKIVKKTEPAIAPQEGSAIYQVFWFSLTRGPLIYAASGLIDGQNREGVFQLLDINPEACFFPVDTPDGLHGPAFELRVNGHKPLLFLPYYEAGRRMAGVWRLTWLQNIIEQ